MIRLLVSLFASLIISGESFTLVKDGLTPIYQENGNYYMGIPESIIDRDILMVTRVVKAPASMQNTTLIYAGDQLNSGMFQFRKGKGNTILLCKQPLFIQAEESSPMYQAVQNSNLPAIVASFSNSHYLKEKNLWLIKIEDLLNSDTEVLFFTKQAKKNLGFGNFEKDKSYIDSIITFPINTEIKTTHTYKIAENGEFCSILLNCSFVLLPEEPMKVRLVDERVGFFSQTFIDFNVNPQRAVSSGYITRWRIEPKEEDKIRYENGELVEPEKPIVFYVDPATPEKWIPYIIQGVNDWQVAFEAAGFKNAIYALPAPSEEEDSLWSLSDARHSAIIYKASTTENANGPHVHDPRSGEIIESHVQIHNNVLKLLHDWYFVQCSVVDAQGRGMNYPDELMGRLLRFLVSHEVGHTLGLRHNFKASSHYPTAALRNIDSIRANGITASIMDYTRFNYAAQPEDSLPVECLIPQIGHYDKWAIEWGYRFFSKERTHEEERDLLNKWIVAKTENPFLQFGRAWNRQDPRSQAEDIGNNQMETATLGIKNLQVVMDSLPAWSQEKYQDKSSLREMYNQVKKQYFNYMLHSLQWIGGIYENVIFCHVEREKQEEALLFLCKELFTYPQWLAPDYLFSYLNIDAEAEIREMQKQIIERLIDRERFERLNHLSLINLLQTINNHFFGTFSDRNTRALQRLYVERLIAISNLHSDINNNDIDCIISITLLELSKQLEKSKVKDKLTREHYQLLNRSIKKVL